MLYIAPTGLGLSVLLGHPPEGEDSGCVLNILHLFNYTKLLLLVHVHCKGGRGLDNMCHGACVKVTGQSGELGLSTHLYPHYSMPMT